MDDTKKEIRQWTTKQDGLENLQLGTASMPEPKEGEVLVKINCVSLNYRDTEGLSFELLATNPQLPY